jgi:HlyD family secretion protein
VEIEAARHPDVLTLAADAVRDVGTERPWVLVVVGDRAERREVRLGLRGQDAVEIVEGLTLEDRAIATTEAGIEPGMRVRARESTP